MMLHQRDKALPHHPGAADDAHLITFHVLPTSIIDNLSYSSHGPFETGVGEKSGFTQGRILYYNVKRAFTAPPKTTLNKFSYI